MTRHGEGSITKQSNGTFRAYWTDANGKEVGTEAKFVPEVTASTTDTAYTANFELIPVPEKTLDDVKAEKLTEIENNYSVAKSVT